MSITDQMIDDDEELAKSKRVYGVAIGIVTKNKDPNGEGRIKVKLPWLSEQNETDWVKITTIMAGKDFGVFFLPEVGDEVLMAFEQGDVNYPYVIGSLWSGKDIPPESNSDGENNIRMIKTRSGHEITFDDTSGGEKLEIKDKSGKNVITLDSVANSVSIESGMTLEITAKSIKIEADTELTLKSGGMLTIKGSMVKIN